MGYDFKQMGTAVEKLLNTQKSDRADYERELKAYRQALGEYRNTLKEYQEKLDEYEAIKMGSLMSATEEKEEWTEAGVLEEQLAKAANQQAEILEEQLAKAANQQAEILEGQLAKAADQQAEILEGQFAKAADQQTDILREYLAKTETQQTGMLEEQLLKVAKQQTEIATQQSKILEQQGMITEKIQRIDNIIIEPIKKNYTANREATVEKLGEMQATIENNSKALKKLLYVSMFFNVICACGLGFLIACILLF